MAPFVHYYITPKPPLDCYCWPGSGISNILTTKYLQRLRIHPSVEADALKVTKQQLPLTVAAELLLDKPRIKPLDTDPVAFRTRSRVRCDSHPASGPPFQSLATSSSGTESSIKTCMAVDRFLVQNKENIENGESLGDGASACLSP